MLGGYQGEYAFLKFLGWNLDPPSVIVLGDRAFEEVIKVGMVTHTCNSSYLGSGGRRIVSFEGFLGQLSGTLS